MEAGISAAASSASFRLVQNPFLFPKSVLKVTPTSSLLLLRPIHKRNAAFRCTRKLAKRLTVCFVIDEQKLVAQSENEEGHETDSVTNQSKDSVDKQIISVRMSEKLARKKSERLTYLIAAVMSSFGITSMAVMAVYYRFYWQTEGGEVPLTEMFGTFALSVGAAVGMEFWARWAHRALWHASLWHMHESHHRAREGPFELNDVFAIINAVPAIGLLSYGFFHKGLFPGLCFGAGLGITVFGMAYMFVHDGLVHKRFPVGPIANVPYFRRVAAAHQEVEEVGGLEELEKEINRRAKSSRGS
ncbi:Phospholipase A2 crotoxin acid subunit CA [Ancistrocladus abbreviatus]